MIPEIGHFALVLALVVMIVQAVIPQIGAATGRQGWMKVADMAAMTQVLLVGIAFAALMTAYIQSDFSVLNVAENSHTAKPLLYKITGVWANHEGSLLLWIFILAIYGTAVAVFGDNLPPTLKARVLAVQATVGVGFLLFILATSNPFIRLDPAPLQGNGLNPLLQDPGLAFHPPFLYLGYVGLSIAFSFSIAALIEGRVDPAWARWVRPWTLTAWIFLTIGIGIGSYWAYYELGWGGWWFWDPVENASFMPWLAATALLHSAIVVEKRDALKNWTILLAILAFSLSLLGTFIVRSGVLNSVHAFASDPTRGFFILLFLASVVGGALFLYALRAPGMKLGGVFAPISREGALVLNNLLLVAAAATVLIGTLYPLFLDALTGEKVSVGPPFYNATFVPLIAPLLATLSVGPMLPWKRGDLAGALSRLKAVFAIAFLGAVLTLWLAADVTPLSILGIVLGLWLVFGALAEFADRIKLFAIPLEKSVNRAKGLPKSAWGMTLAHVGVGVMVLGITISDTWQDEVLTSARPGDTLQVAGYDLEFQKIGTVPGPNYQALQATFRVTRDGELVTMLYPSVRTFTNPPMQTTEAAIRPTLLGDIYLALGEPDGDGAYAFRLYYKPFVIWIWLGGLFMAIGGLVSLADRRHRIGAPVRRRARPAPGAAE